VLVARHGVALGRERGRQPGVVEVVGLLDLVERGLDVGRLDLDLRLLGGLDDDLLVDHLVEHLAGQLADPALALLGIGDLLGLGQHRQAADLELAVEDDRVVDHRDHVVDPQLLALVGRRGGRGLAGGASGGIRRLGRVLGVLVLVVGLGGSGRIGLGRLLGVRLAGARRLLGLGLGRGLAVGDRGQRRSRAHDDRKR